MEPEEQIRYLILAAQREGNQMLTKGLEGLGVTTSQAEVLRILDEFGPLTLLGLGRLLVCEPGSPSRLIKHLTARRLVSSRRDKSDRRSMVIRLTKEGRRLTEEIKHVESSMYALIDQMLPGEKKAQLIDLMNPLVGQGPHGRALRNRQSKSK